MGGVIYRNRLDQRGSDNRREGCKVVLCWPIHGKYKSTLKTYSHRFGYVILFFSFTKRWGRLNNNSTNIYLFKVNNNTVLKSVKQARILAVDIG